MIEFFFCFFSFLFFDAIFLIHDDKEFWRKNAYARKSVFELFFVDVSAKTLQVAPG